MALFPRGTPEISSRLVIAGVLEHESRQGFALLGADFTERVLTAINVAKQPQ